MKARDGIEAQRGLNDVWPGDEYPVVDHGPEFWREGGILTSEVDEDLMLTNMQHCYGGDTRALRVSVEHYRYLVEQIVSLRQHVKRII
jgi:hypothetical protein